MAESAVLLPSPPVGEGGCAPLGAQTGEGEQRAQCPRPPHPALRATFSHHALCFAKCSGRRKKLAPRHAASLIKRSSSMHKFRIIALCASIAALAAPADARITRIDITTTQSPTFDGTSFGTTGPYEKLVGRVFGEVDPKDPRNAIITDIKLAPVNARGMVEYSGNILIMRPVDRGQGQSQAAVRDQQPRPHPRAGVAQRRGQEFQRSRQRRRRRQRLPDAPGLYARLGRMGRDFTRQPCRRRRTVRARRAGREKSRWLRHHGLEPRGVRRRQRHHRRTVR